MQDSRIQFGRKLKELRLARGFSKGRHLAAVLGVNENTYYRFERGENFPALPVLQKICSVLSVPVTELIPAHDTDQGQFGDGQPLSPFSGDGAASQPSQEFRETEAPYAGSGSLTDGPTSAKLRCSLAAWALAEAIVSHSSSAGGATENESASRLVDCAQLYLRLKADPFGTVADVSARWSQALGHQEWITIAGLIDDFISSFRGFATGQED